ncbi:hypothetical protein EBB07_28180 [Paenibacillaceae bacterium]|nr:hypothetical protein EBB07_28180 [Paenibacillaceae bacterium]
MSRNIPFGSVVKHKKSGKYGTVEFSSFGYSVHTYVDSNGQQTLEKTAAMKESELLLKYKLVKLPKGCVIGEYGGVIKEDSIDFLWRMVWDFGRIGEVRGVFIATQKQVSNAIGKYIRFGEVLGKYSEVGGILHEDCLERISVSSGAIEEISSHLGSTWSGYNPLSYVRYDCKLCKQGFYADEMEESKNPKICIYCEDEELQEEGENKNENQY